MRVQDLNPKLGLLWVLKNISIIVDNYLSYIGKAFYLSQIIIEENTFSKPNMQKPNDFHLLPPSAHPPRKSNAQVSSLNLSSNFKLPTLNEIIQDWKLLACTKGNKMDESLLPYQSMDELDGYITFLTNKVNHLETALQELTRKHYEVCLVLQREVKMKDTKSEVLIRENSELKRELNDMLEQVKVIVSKHIGKSGQKITKRVTKLGKLRNKENEQQGRGIRCITYLGESESKSLPRTELSRVKLKGGTSLLKTRYEEQRKDMSKLCQIKDQYYHKSDYRLKPKGFTQRIAHKTVFSPSHRTNMLL